MEIFFAETYDPNDFEVFKNQFKISELRSMSRSSVILRSLALRGMARVPFDSIERHLTGVYLIGEEGNFSTLNVESVFNQNDKESVDTFRKIPAKSLIGLPISMSAAQIEMASGACGPIVCAAMTSSSIEFILDEIQSDLASERIKSFFVGAFREQGHEAAWLVFANSWSQNFRLKLQEQLEQIIHVAENQ